VSDSPFEALLGAARQALLVQVDGQLRIVRAGVGAAELAERTPEGMVGMSLIAAFGSAAMDAVARDALAADRPAVGEATLGQWAARDFAIEAVPVPPEGLVLILHEITALRRLERVRRDFVANLGHELRTPLASIKLLAETLASGSVEDAAAAHDFAVQIERETDHLAQLVDELRDLSMIESGETPLVLEPIAPDRVVASLIERIGPVADRRGILVRALPGPADAAGVRALADGQRLGQALLNLAHNAVKFSHPGGEVRVGWELHEGRVRFLVADDGIGIPAGHRDRIFERFYKVNRSRARDEAEELTVGGSAGLGLAIVRHIAAAHGGGVGLTSEEGVGSTFWIEVPRAPG
jgi:two-component system phosphate regulon sensor histidine kinase PhoR